METVCSHSIKKFELMENYIEIWLNKLSNFKKCKTIVYVDCTCNSGLYLDKKQTTTIEGTAIRVYKKFVDCASRHPNKNYFIFFNDFSKCKIDKLKDNISQLKLVSTNNLKIKYDSRDAESYLKDFFNYNNFENETNLLLFYDPYNASIKVDSLDKFINGWCEVIANNISSDLLRNFKNNLNEEKIEEYHDIYGLNYKDALKKIDNNTISEVFIRVMLSKHRNIKQKQYVSVVPVLNSVNTIVYYLTYFTHSLVGQRSFKKCVWDLSTNETCSLGGNFKSKADYQTTLNLGFKEKNSSDLKCFYDLCVYVKDKFAGKEKASLKDLYTVLDESLFFPTEGYKENIKKALSKENVCIIKKGVCFFVDKQKKNT